MIKELMNKSQIAAAHSAQMFFNAHKPETAEAIESYVSFLPYPTARMQVNSIVKSLTPDEASELISYYDSLPFECTIRLDKYKPDLVAIAQQDV